ncbi:cupin [Agaricicola taiwanensis]|uniref:Cupin n=1 Tax=Agaricicola taiwanensis TaxID=591372 RepID=A0A8J2Y9S3_9RHOB|nr:cupin domain-containing protein [Agaricicola taiwanensis]GGE27086.1 cupin [Agaricicola taiwanensis]
MTAEEIISCLDLRPHPEGGWFRETFRDNAHGPERGHSTAIYFLLKKGERSHWHRVRDASETWHHYAGAPLILSLFQDGDRAPRTLTLSADLLAGHEPQAVVPPDCWQAAETLGDWTLVGCTVAPGFSFEAFELAPPGWSPIP